MNMEIKEFWESDEAMQANRRDHILKRLEIEEIARHVRDGMRVLDVGCGDGETGEMLIRRFRIDWTGLDASEQMVRAADARLEAASADQHAPMRGCWVTWRGSIVGDDTLAGMVAEYRYDLVYTERMLINLPDWPTQAYAIRNILALLKPGGTYLMIEHSQDGLDALNKLRVAIGLPAIELPWHNRYLREAEVRRLAGEVCVQGFFLWAPPFPDHFASDYYYHSRIVNAWLAAQQGKEPDYDAPINRLAKSFPVPVTSDLGPAAMWIWRKV